MNALPYVISSRVRLARNLRSHRFPQAASDNEREMVRCHVQHAVSAHPRFHNATMVFVDSLNPLERKVLEEKRFISHLFATQGSSRLIILPKTGDISVLVNEEDHLRIQAFSPGLSISTAWENAQKLEGSLQKVLDFAYSEQYGYVTTCPENSGSGLRVSAMLFVPGLILLQRINPLVQQCFSAGFTIRGTYGEGSLSQGYVLQISNQRPYERRVMPILKEFEAVCRHIIKQEKLARHTLLADAGKMFRQRTIWARKQLLTQQAVDLHTGVNIVAMYRLIVALGIKSPHLKTIYCRGWNRYQSLQRLDRLLIQIQPAHVRKHGIRQYQTVHPGMADIHEDHEDTIRAQLLQHALLR